MLQRALFTTLALAALALVGSVAAHGYVDHVFIGDTFYEGWHPFEDFYSDPQPARIMRRIPSDSPIEDIWSPDMACNVGGNDPNGLTGDIQAGSPISFVYSRWPPEHSGSVTVWMASCQGSCNNFQASNAKWFAIDKKGYNNGVWATTDLINQGLKWTAYIPSNLKPGEYLVRIELLAMHSTGAPQFYPACAQVNVHGNGNLVPGDGEAVSIQEIYAGFNFPDIWSYVPFFEAAGPKVASLVSYSPPPPPANEPKNETPSETTPAVSDAIPSRVPNPLCRRRLKKRLAARAALAASSHQRRSFHNRH